MNFTKDRFLICCQGVFDEKREEKCTSGDISKARIARMAWREIRGSGGKFIPWREIGVLGGRWQRCLFSSQ